MCKTCVITVIFDLFLYNECVRIKKLGGRQMLEQLRRLAMIGIGGTALAVEKLADLVDDLVDQGKLTVDEGKKLTEELIQTKKEEVDEKGREEIESILLDMNIAQRKDIERLEKRIKELEEKGPEGEPGPPKPPEDGPGPEGEDGPPEPPKPKPED